MIIEQSISAERAHSISLSAAVYQSQSMASEFTTVTQNLSTLAMITKRHKK